MKVIKVKSNSTYKNKKGEEKNYYNYFLQLDNDKRIAIKPSFSKDYARLDVICEYVGK